MNKIFKSAVALTLTAVIGLSVAACGKKQKTQLDLEKFPLVYADEKGLEAIREGEEKPTLITDKFYTFLNADRKVQAASDGKVYYVQTKDKKTTLGDLYTYDVEKKESELVHAGVYSFKVSHDGECLIFTDGTGGIYRYDSKSEKKDNYVPIQSKGVSAVLDISADGKYVLYSQVLEATNYYTLTIAKTDFQTDETIDKMSLKERKANKDINKAPVMIAENYKEYLGGADDLSVLYYTQGSTKKDSKNTVLTLNAFKKFKDNVVLCNKETENYFVSESGEIFFSANAKNQKKVSDILTDKYAAADKKLKKEKASKKAWNAKVKRDGIRDKVNTYLKNITTTNFFRFDASSDKAELVLQVNGQLTHKGTDTDLGVVFFGATVYDFESAKKPDINKVSMAYKLFDSIKYRVFFSIDTKEMKTLKIGKSAYNGGDVFVDTTAKRISIIMDMDYLKTKVGKLYTLSYDEKGFGKEKMVSKKAAKVAHFESGEDIYFTLADNTLVKNDEKTVVLKNYGYASNNEKVKMIFTSVGTGKKDKYGNEIMKDTAYVLGGKKPEKIDTVFTSKNIVDKGNMFAFFTSYDYKSGSGEMKLFNGKKVISLSKQVSMIYKFS
ncbi:MAG: hypothetical protein IJG23_04680 [Clostridia bacterium]|nr:hypothetical protein [Clostridia bacterium]